MEEYMSSQSQSVMRSQRKKKLFAVEQFGGKCQLCGYDKCLNALLFHHLDPSMKNKKITPSYIIMRWSWKRAFEELEKCILVCANCHAEVHYKVTDINSKQLSAPIVTKVCERCSQSFETKKAAQMYCGIGCKTLAEQKVNRIPQKAELQKLIERKTPWTQIGKIYGVTDNSMRKWARKYNLIE